MAQFINAKENLVTEALDGIIAASGGSLGRLDGYPHIKVVFRTDLDKSKVALISGGGSGHEPAHAGFVGAGMLTAAVCGEVFASPSVEAVLAGILAVTGDAGCLLIVKNYTGDRLNFGLAAERARALGRKVEMVVVDDDIALPNLPQPRGVAGTLFVHKVAGSLAEAGKDLATVTSAAKQVITKVASLGMSLSTCTVPGSPKEERIAAGKAELGLGIHGEPGVEQVDFASAEMAISSVLNKLKTGNGNGTPIALINNLGSTTPLEMSVLTHSIAQTGGIEYVVGPAPMMTSLDMHGFSISIFEADATELAAIQDPVSLTAWPGLVALGAVDISPLPDGLTPIEPIASDNPRTRATLEHVSDLLIAAESKLNALDAKSGDGDTGSTLAGAARALKGNLDRLPLADLTQLFPALGNELSHTMGGSSGVILAIFFNAAGDACANGYQVFEAMSAGLDRVSQVGGARVGDRTMIDALAPALDALPDGIAKAAAAARRGADGTASIHRAKAGRAAYVPEENLKGHNDPGAEAVAILFEGLAKILES
ncbi:MAG: dihydroxyacetone kinase subunit DhaK [Paracoccaceae bacterium]